MPGSNADSDHRFRDEARALLRQWLAADEDAVSGSIDAIGARAIRSAAEATARLDRLPPPRSATATLATLDALAADLAAPAQPAPRRFFARAQPPVVDVRQRIATLVEDLDRERDAIARAAIGLATDRERLAAAAAELDRAQGLIRAVVAAVAAATRELAVDRPDRARFLRDTAEPRLLEREQDILSQAAVTQQGLLTLALLADGQDALARALARARTITLAALRTAVAARRAVAAGTDMASAAATLDRTTAGDAPDHALAAALDHARQEIDSAGTAPTHRAL